MKLVIHIGSDKCGSTAIQKSLSMNCDKLKEHDIYIPKTGLGKMCGHSSCFIDGNKKFFDELVKELDEIKSKYEVAIISWEGLHFISESNLYQKYDDLRKFDIKVIYYVRDQAEIIQTGILQQWKTYNCKLPFNKITPATRMYDATADRWAKFTGGTVEVVAYDRKNFPDSDIALDFYKRVSSKDLSFIKTDTKDPNESLSYEGAYFIAFMDRNFTLNESERGNLVDAILNSQRHFELTKYYFSENEVNEIRSHYADSNLRLKQKYGVDLCVNLQPCWINTGRKDSLHPELVAKCLELYKFPVLRYGQSNPFNLDRALISGWYERENWGTWAKGNESVIQFRIGLQAISEATSESEQIDIEITGRYFKLAKTSSDIEINGRKYDNVDLTGFRFSIPVMQIIQDSKVEIIIRSNYAVSPLAGNLGDDSRELSYGIKNIRLVRKYSGTRKEGNVRGRNKTKAKTPDDRKATSSVFSKIKKMFRK